jgi:hypothetical protein
MSRGDADAAGKHKEEYGQNDGEKQKQRANALGEIKIDFLNRTPLAASRALRHPQSAPATRTSNLHTQMR